MFVRSVYGDIRLEGAEVIRAAMDDVLQLQYTPQGSWAMLFLCALEESDLLDASCAAAEQADDGVPPGPVTP
ncbi:MAG: hypothetical protein ACI4MK_15680 [Aristaeellaceae bacterium]